MSNTKEATTKQTQNIVKDMTEGSPIVLIVSFAIPLILGNLFQQLYNIIDTIIVGRYLGIGALASVGASTSVLFLVQGFCMGLCSGFSIPVAQRFGAKDYGELKNYVAMGFILSGIIAVAITSITCLACGGILNIMRTPEDIMDEAYLYLFVIFAGLPFTILYNFTAGVIRAVGDSRTPFKYLVYATCINIVMDIVFITVFKLGVVGAALATVLSQAISGMLCLKDIIYAYEVLKLKRDNFKYRRNLANKLLMMGIPMGLQFSITAIGSVMLQSAVNVLGSTCVAAYTAAIKIKQMFICVFDSLGNALSTYTGQNLGAGRIKRIEKGIWHTIIICVVISIIVDLIVFVFGRWLIGLFVDASQVEVIDYAFQYIKYISVCFWVLGFLNSLRYAIQGMGYSRLAILSGTLEMVARTSMALFAITAYGWVAACMTDQAAWISATLFLIPTTIIIVKKKKKLYGE